MINPPKYVGYWKPNPGTGRTVETSVADLLHAHGKRHGLSEAASKVLGAIAARLIEPELLDPRTLVDEAWDPREKKLVVDHLRRGRKHMGYMGCSQCRFCGVQNGSWDFTDGVYVWPEGFAHYLTDHAVRPPDDFIAHVKRFKPGR